VCGFFGPPCIANNPRLNSVFVAQVKFSTTAPALLSVYCGLGGRSTSTCTAIMQVGQVHRNVRGWKAPNHILVPHRKQITAQATVWRRPRHTVAKVR